jgi:hypothetical protein
MLERDSWRLIEIWECKILRHDLELPVPLKSIMR